MNNIMKKLFAFALCVATVGMAGAQKANVEQAKKLSGKVDKIEDARTLIKDAMSNPETAKDAGTYYVAGKIEYDAFDKGVGKLAVNPNDESVNKIEMAKNLINGYKYFLETLPYDQLPNEKGQVKPKYTKDIAGKLASHTEYYFNMGAEMFNAQKYYPEAYESFMIYGDMPTLPLFGGKGPQVPDSVRATSYFNAGLAGWSANQVAAAEKGFRKACELGYNQPEAYVYDIACWQNMAQNDSTLVDEAKKNIMAVAQAGYNQFGISQPLFINNMVNSYVSDGQMDSAIAKINELLEQHPDNANLYGLRGFVYDRMGKDDESVADYMAAVSNPTVDYETLKNAAKKIFRVGTDKWNNADTSNPTVKKDIKTKYFDVAKSITDKAKSMKSEPDSDLDYVIENINYALETFFN